MIRLFLMCARCGETRTVQSVVHESDGLCSKCLGQKWVVVLVFEPVPQRKETKP